MQPKVEIVTRTPGVDVVLILVHELRLHGQHTLLLLLGQILLFFQDLLELVNVKQLLVELLLVHVLGLQDVDLGDNLLLEHLLVQNEVVRSQFRLYGQVNLTQVLLELRHLILGHWRVVDVDSGLQSCPGWVLHLGSFFLLHYRNYLLLFNARNYIFFPLRIERRTLRNFELIV